MTDLFKEYQELLNTNLSLQSFIQHSALDGVWFLELDQIDRSWYNSTFLKTLGFNDENDSSSHFNFKDTVDKDDLALLMAKIQQSKKDELIVEQVLKFKAKNNSTIWLRCKGFVILNESGAATRMIGTLINITVEKKTAIELAHCIKQHNQVIEGSELATWEWNLENDVLILNDHWKRLLDYADNELGVTTIKWWADRIHKDDIAQVESKLITHLKGETKKLECQLRMLKKDNTWIWLSCKGKVIEQKNGRATLISGFHQDLSESKKYADELEHYKNLLEHSNEVAKIGTWEVDIAKNEVQWSKVTREIHEVDEDFIPLISKGLEFYKKGKDRDKITSEFNLAATEGKSFDLELRIVTAKGNLKWIRTVGVPQLSNGKLVKVYGVFQDISDKKFHEEALQKSYNQTKVFIEQSPSALAMFDLELNYLAASKQWLTDYKLKNKNIIGMNHYEVFPGIGEDWKTMHQNCLKGETHRKDEDEFVREDGTSQWLTWEVKPWYNLNNEIGGLIMYTAIITPLIEAQQKAKNMLEVMTKQNDRLLNFSHIVSHNLRSHTSNMTMLLDFMDKDKSTEALETYYPMFKKATTNLSETIQNLNDVANMNMHSSDALETLNLKAYIDKNIATLDASIIDVNCNLSISVDPKITVKAIPAYLDSILLNLFTNAIKYKSEERQLKLRVTATKTKKYIIITVSDNGLGIDLKKHRKKLFGMYKVFHKHKDSRGVGLFITKSQIDAMNGKVEIESEVNKGTSFNVYLLR